MIIAGGIMFGKALGKLWGEGRAVVDETEQIDDRFYAEVMDELSQGFKDKSAVGKAIAQSDGNEARFDSIYMKLRARALQEEFIKKDKFRLEQQQIEQIEQELLISSIRTKYKKGLFERHFKDKIKSYGYTHPFLGPPNYFKKDGKWFHGKIDYKTMNYILVDEHEKVMNMFKFDPKEFD